jgi:hypothetical protein
MNKRCREGHHKWENEKCVECGKQKKEKNKEIGAGESNKLPSPSSSALSSFSSESSATTLSSSRSELEKKLSAIASLKQSLPTQEIFTDTSDQSTSVEPDDGIHIGDIVAPPIVDLEIAAIGAINRRFYRRQIPKDIDTEKPREALAKWIKHRWPKVSTTPFGELVTAHILMIASIQIGSTPLPPKQIATAPVNTVSPDSNSDRDTASNAGSPPPKISPISQTL